VIRRRLAWLTHRVDDWRRSTSDRRRVLVYARNAMHLGVLDPVTRALARDPRIVIRYMAELPWKEAHIDRATRQPRRWWRRPWAGFRRVDLLITADPWNPPTLYRCHRRMNFFHGVAGKYDLDNPTQMPIGFGDWDAVAFINTDRMDRYAALGLLKPGAATLVGYPKLDALVNGRYDAAAVRSQLGFEMHRPTALYAPTWSPASSLNLAGEAIVGDLVAHGWNVVIKPHDLSFDPDPKYSGGIDWRTRLRAIESPGRVVLRDDANLSPLLAASDVLVTDHSTAAFEFFVLDRPVVVFDAPDLARVARINPERIALLRSAARVVHAADEVAAAAADELAHAGRLSRERTAIAARLFFEPGTATARALSRIYGLLELRDAYGVLQATPLQTSSA
jgi:CDP-glycerol:poly(glycerophosphate) glycerophosphotransferase